MFNILYLFTVYFIMNPTLETLINKRAIWQGKYTPKPENTARSGYPELDEQLGGGIPQQGVIDLQSDIGIGELRLLLPYLRDRHQQQQRLLVYIAPPIVINSEMLAAYGVELSRLLIIEPKNEQEALWAAEQCLKSGCCHSVLLWQAQLQVHQVKRLQLASQQGAALQVMFRPVQSMAMGLPTTLSLQLSPDHAGIKVTIRRRKGGRRSEPFQINMHQHWPELALPEPPVSGDNVIPFPGRQAV